MSVDDRLAFDIPPVIPLFKSGDLRAECGVERLPRLDELGGLPLLRHVAQAVHLVGAASEHTTPLVVFMNACVHGVLKIRGCGDLTRLRR